MYITTFIEYDNKENVLNT